MKKTVIIFCCVFLFLSCKTQKTTLSPFVTVYKSDWVGMVRPSYIILRKQPEVFEIYAPGIYESIFGEWNISNDTLFLFPKYEYFSRDFKMRLSEITDQDTSIVTIPQQYLIKKDRLIDITDYSIIALPEPLNFNPDFKEVYKRVDSK